MASKKNKKLYRDLRRAGLRKRSARALSKVGGGRSNGRQRQEIARLRTALGELESRAGMDDRGGRTAAERLEVDSIRDVSVR